MRCSWFTNDSMVIRSLKGSWRNSMDQALRSSLINMIATSREQLYRIPTRLLFQVTRTSNNESYVNDSLKEISEFNNKFKPKS